MATLSRKTMGTAIEIMSSWSQPTIEHFFFKNDIPNDIIPTNVSKLKMVLGVFQTLDKEQDQDKIQELISELLKGWLRDNHRKELEQALLRDGFVVSNSSVIDAEPDIEERQSAVIALIRKYESDFDCDTLTHHLTECEDLFHQGKWDSSISHCRNFVEQLVSDIATNIATAKNDTPNLSQPRLVRDYLLKVAFFDESEKKKLVDGVYGYFSEQGSHPGISTQSAARVSKSILLAFAFYTLEKYDAWKNGNFILP